MILIREVLVSMGFEKKELDSKILSICIPTYNRPKVLLNSINHSSINNYSDYEIVITDNSNNDETQDMLKQINDNRIKYFRNPTNLGVVFNILNVLSKAEGVFLLLVSDEDYIDTENLILFLKQVKLKSDSIPNLILTSVRNSNKELLVHYPDKKLKKSFNSFYNLTYKSTEISGIIFRRRNIEFNRYFDELDKPYNGTIGYFPHNIIVNDLLRLGDVITTSKIFVNNWTNEKDLIETYNSKPYYHYENVYRTFKTRIDYILYIDEFTNNQKRLLYVKVLYQNSLTIESYFQMYNNRKYEKYRNNLELIEDYIEIKSNLQKIQFEMNKYINDYQTSVFDKVIMKILILLTRIIIKIKLTINYLKNYIR